MTNTNEAVVNEEVVAPKKKRVVKPRPTKTGQQIIEEAGKLQVEVTELEVTVQDPAISDVVRTLVTEAYEAKKAELAKVLDTKYTF